MLLAPINITQYGLDPDKHGNEGTIAINPANPSRLFAAYNVADVLNRPPEAKYSSDGGATWQASTLPSSDDYVPFSDPYAAFDKFGNLYFTYLNRDPTGMKFYVVVTRSTDFGRTFSELCCTYRFASDDMADKPSIATGPGGTQAESQVVVSWSHADGTVSAAASAVNFFGDDLAFGNIVQVGGRGGINQGIAIGPDGTVMVSWQTVDLANPGGPSDLYVATAPALLQLPFRIPSLVEHLNIGYKTPLGSPGPLYSDLKGISTVAGLAWDRSTGLYNGRVYVAYTNSPAVGSTDTNIFLKYSDNNGGNWTFGNASQPINDDHGTTPQFLPQIALDQTSGNVAVAWYDARNSITNKTVEIFASVSTDGGDTWAANRTLSGGASDANKARDGDNFGDYNTMAAHGGSFFPIWADNSGQLQPPPPATKDTFNMATVRARFSDFGGGGSGASGSRIHQSLTTRGTGFELPTAAVLLGDTRRSSQDVRSMSEGVWLVFVQQPVPVFPQHPTDWVATNTPPSLHVPPLDRLFGSTPDELSGAALLSSRWRSVELGDIWPMQLTATDSGLLDKLFETQEQL
jgi:hypothetical protein